LQKIFRRFSNQAEGPVAALLSRIVQPKFRLLSLALGFILASVALCCLILFLQRFKAVTAVSFQIAVRDAAPADDLLGCFYYDTGRGFSEAEKACFEYSRLPLNQFQNYQVFLPTRRPVFRVRFAPLQEPGVVALRSLAFGRSPGLLPKETNSQGSI
jgi:hypothetical protein